MVAEKGRRPKSTHISSPRLKNDVIEYLRGINVVSCGGNGRKWTKFVSRKLRRALCSVGYMQCAILSSFEGSNTAIYSVMYALLRAV